MIEQVRSDGKFFSCALEVSGSSLDHDLPWGFPWLSSVLADNGRDRSV